MVSFAAILVWTISTTQLTATFNELSGSMLSCLNRLTGGRKDFRDEPFLLTTSAGEFSSRDCRVTARTATDGNLDFRYSCGPFELGLSYQIQKPDGAVIRKLLRITNRGDGAVTLFRIGMFDWTIPSVFPSGYPHSYYPDGVQDIHFHKSGIWYDHSISLFLRDASGGLFVGVENPYFEANYRTLRKVYPATVEISYRPNWVLSPGESFESDQGFAGVYRQEHIYCTAPIREYFGGRERMRSEVLDWGEVWAMQDYMRSLMPVHETPTGKYYLAHWGLADPSALGAIQHKKDAGHSLSPEERAMAAHFGGGPFGFRKDELWYRLTPETLRFYQTVVDDAASLGEFQTLVVPNMMAGHAGWFASPEEKAESHDTDAWFSKPAFPLWNQLADYAGGKGLRMFLLELVGRAYRPDRPDWKYLASNGKRLTSNCYANREYVDWYTSQLDRALTTHPIGHLQWDEGWMDVLTGFIGEEARCYDATHGHLPGNVSYQQFRNVQLTLDTLRKNHPQVQLVIISGLIRGMPWIMRDLDADSHTGAMENAAWVDHNQYFLPPSRSHRQGGIHWIVRNLSAGEEPSGTGEWYQMLADPDRREKYRTHLRRWTEWATENHALLEHQRDLFYSALPGTGLQGSAHCQGDRGFVFLHNPTALNRTGEITVNQWLGINPHERFRVRKIYPEAASTAEGVYPWEESLRLMVPPKGTLLFEIQSTSEPIRRTLPGVSPTVPVERAFLRLADLRNVIGVTDLWRALTLPGSGKMPGF